MEEHPKKKKKGCRNPETKFQFELNSCSKAKDLRGAISLYDDAVSNNTRLNQHHFNALLYLCSNSVADPSLKPTALDYGFRAFRHMSALAVLPNEATVTAVARLAAAKGDADYAFELVKSMGKNYNNALPRLRTYDPALFCFCEMLDADKAYEVEEHMNGVGVSLEEAELAALLKVSARCGRVDKVYEYLHRLRSSVRCVSESTAVVIEEWFRGSKASEVGEAEFDAGRVKEGVLRNGGGWHGQGWVGKGDWVVSRTSVVADGHCCCCGQQLVCVDIDDVETEKFAGSVAALAFEREVKANFSEFQAWLEKHASYEAIVDGANIGLYQQNFADGGFNISQLDDVVKELYNRSGKKWPLVVLHNKRLRGLMENPSSRRLVEEWMKNGVLYTTPNGSNDDWYWLFAAVKLRCLLVHYTFVKGNLKLQMPPSYSLVIQIIEGMKNRNAKEATILFPSKAPTENTPMPESEKGYWHVPLVSGTSCESTRCWLCITRPSGHDAVATVSNGVSSLDSQVDENSATSIAEVVWGFSHGSKEGGSGYSGWYLAFRWTLCNE
ncbi:hypothetical protein JHK85_038615 [Glycine max]|nr:hypothetical protein JHK85_038615 [Glycine max]